MCVCYYGLYKGLNFCTQSAALSVAICLLLPDFIFDLG